MFQCYIEEGKVNKNAKQKIIQREALLSFRTMIFRKTCEATYTKLTKTIWPELTPNLQEKPSKILNNSICKFHVRILYENLLCRVNSDSALLVSTERKSKMFHAENQNQNQNHATIYSDPKQLPKLGENQTIIQCSFKQPARKYLVILDSSLFTPPESVPENYKALITNALQSAAKAILKGFVAEFSLVPSSVSKELFSLENLLDKANDAASENLSKEELEELWKASETRKFYLGKDQYKTSSQYRKVFASFEELILKLQGNKAKFTADELDKILIKIKEEDFTGDFGQYVAKRVAYFKNKPVKESAGIDIL